ncbi:MAG: hypothetical protein QM747_00405 [Nocardioides sp.]
MRGTSRRILGVLGVAVLASTLLGQPAAWAAPPVNDNRADEVLLTPPQSVTGTLVEATLEVSDDSSACAGTDSSVWYRFSAPSRGAVVVELDAGGEMDATVDLYRQVRSKLSLVDCGVTDENGSSTLVDDGLKPGATYALRIGNQTGSVPDTFRLRVLVPTPPPAPPGRHLPKRGVRNRVDRVLNPGDAFWTHLRAGRTMRLSLRSRLCTSLEVFAPGTTDFATAIPEKQLPCGGFTLYTPTTSGRHFLVVRAARDRDIHHYRLRVAPAGPDDTTPGLPIRNHGTARGHVNGGIDERDLYRFDVTRRSALTLRLLGTPSMTLVRDDGLRLGFGNLLSGRLRRGRYFVAVSGQGRYALHLSLRTITQARLTVNGHRAATVGPGARPRLTVHVRPLVAGPAQIVVQRLDPVEGWQFLRRFRLQVVRGSATVVFSPPTIGRYRAFAQYLGTRDAAPTDTGRVRLQVQRPLGDLLSRR